MLYVFELFIDYLCTLWYSLLINLCHFVRCVGLYIFHFVTYPRVISTTVGGFGITSAAASSHAAYLSSVASATAIAALHRHARADQPLHDDSILYSQLKECLTTIISTTPSCADDLPTSASTFFSHYHSTESSAPISGLQSTLNTRATQHLFDAALHRAEVAGDIHTVAHHLNNSYRY